ncbi:MAG: polynucleotide adenylyltransferase PcnB [Thermoanaerobaculia bacterium]|nr:polynucleotide adenylyltransferase PcnB [Thermoanaerobaculia bacterium]
MSIREASVEPSEEVLRLREAAVRGERKPKGVEPRLIARADHSVSRKLVSGATLKVLYRLKKSGFKAYLCGGAVRDLMLGRRPKDFDVATNATPREVKRLFRNGRIIGRRFRLVHVIFEGEIVEVSTFRRTPDPKYQRSAPDENLITDDNTWGSPREDAFRRDFTVNALFYSIADFSVIDYCGGVDDLGRSLVRVIGDPDLRFQEDPVRMLRACEFAGRLGFEIEATTRDGIRRNAAEMRKAAPPRMTEELLQLLRCGHAAAAMQWMLDLELLRVVLPQALAMIKADRQGAGGFTNILPTLDSLAGGDRELPDAVLLGAVLLPEVLLRRFEFETKKKQAMPLKNFRRVVEETLESFLQRFTVPKIKTQMLQLAFEGFHRMCGTQWTPAQRSRFASKSYFDDALLLFEILVLATGEGHEALEHWQTAQRQRKHRPQPHVDRKRRSRHRSGMRRRT